MAEELDVKDLYRLADEDRLTGLSINAVRQAIRREANKPDKSVEINPGELEYEQGPGALRDICADIWYDVICDETPFDSQKARAAQLLQIFYEEGCGSQDVDINQCLEKITNYFYRGPHQLGAVFNLLSTMADKMDTPTECPEQAMHNLDTINRWWEESGDKEYDGQPYDLAETIARYGVEQRSRSQNLFDHFFGIRQHAFFELPVKKAKFHSLKANDSKERGSR